MREMWIGLQQPDAPAGLLPEAEFFCRALSRTADAQALARMQELIGQGLDWERLLELADNSRVSSLLFYQLTTLKLHGVPAPALERLNRAFLTLALRGVALLEEFRALRELFRAAEIPALPYKGPHLGLTLYRHHALREAWDLDFIVRAEDVPRVKQLLLERGYRPEREMSPAEEQQFLERDCEFNFDKGEIHVEIHWRIIPRSTGIQLPRQTIWEHCRTENFNGAEVPVLRPEILLLILMIHGGDKHNWGRFKWLVDLDRLLRAEREFDWELFNRLAAAAHARTCCRLGLFLTRRYLDTPVPEALLAPARDQGWLLSRATVAHARLFRPDHSLPRFREFQHYYRQFAGAAGRRSAAALFLLYLRTILAPEFRDRVKLPLPRRLSFLHYLYRPLRMALDHYGGSSDRLK